MRDATRDAAQVDFHDPQAAGPPAGTGRAVKTPAGAFARALPWLAGAGVVMIAALLVAFIFLDEASPFSTPFLAGVLTAASLALASRRPASGREPLRQGGELVEQRGAIESEAEKTLAAAREGVRYPDELMDDFDIPVPGSQPGAARGDELSVYADAMARELTPWRDVAHRLASAIEHDEFILFSQPIVALAAAAPTPFFEILLRLREEEENLMPPGAFLPLAEKHGLMPDIDQWVVRRLLNWAGGDAARCGSIASVNVAGTSMGDPGFVDFVRGALRARAGRGPVLCFEFDEGDAMLDLSATAAFMQELRPAGCRFALSGLSGDPVSFKLLRRLRVDYIKIDGGIVVNMSRNPVDAAKVRAITLAAHATGAMAIAECVEDDATLRALRSMDVDFAQGFGIARPAPLEPAPPR
jgi:EAL domain-containing protein (putative c-di-GMP-specific phosphodiesterase class I)